MKNDGQSALYGNQSRATESEKNDNLFFNLLISQIYSQLFRQSGGDATLIETQSQKKNPEKAWFKKRSLSLCDNNAPSKEILGIPIHLVQNFYLERIFAFRKITEKKYLFQFGFILLFLSFLSMIQIYIYILYIYTLSIQNHTGTKDIFSQNLC